MAELDDRHPARTTDLLGHAAAERTLLAAWQSGRLPHAWLIGGPRGVGKATLAYRFARFVLAGGGAGEGGLFGDAPATSLAVDPDHPAARRIAAGSHPNLRTVTRSVDDKGRLRSAIVVEDIHSLREFFHRTAAEGGWRIVIVDAAEEMNRFAENSILKPLEEPPSKSLILLVSHAPGQLIETIRSRCRRLDLPPLDEDAMARLLERLRPDLGAEDARLARHLAEGSIGRALQLVDGDGLATYREIVELVVRPDGIGGPAAHAVADAWGRAARPGQPDRFAIGTELLQWWLARAAAAAASGRAMAEAVPGESEAARRLLARHGLERTLALWEKIARLARLTDAVHLDRRQVVLDILLALDGEGAAA